MKGDFTRNTFDAKNFFNRVLMQQGRVTLDADFNEQVDILLNYIRTVARDLIGPYAAPSEDPGFKISADKDGISVSAGRYYVDGILVENKKLCAFTAQPDYLIPADDPVLKISEKKDQWFWIYLDVWERYLTSIEVEGIRETALGGPDTCTRTQYVWQVKAMPVNPGDFGYYGYGGYGAYGGYGYPYPYNYPDFAALCPVPLDHLVNLSQIQLAARVDPGKQNTDACVTSPDSKYVGVENHLYRVEIHRGGSAGTATFKWSRDNGSVVTAWLGTNSSESQGVQSNDLVVANTRGFSAGCWVELTDEQTDLQESPGILLKVAKVGGGVLSLDSGSIPASGLPDPTKLRHPKVRRWDQTEKGNIKLDEGAVKVVETPIVTDVDHAGWINLEDGIQIAFAQMPFGVTGKYRPGDYWLIPARVPTGAIEWPPAEQAGRMSLVAPSGVLHHYAPLAFVGWENDNLQAHSCLCEFAPINSCFRRKTLAFGADNLSTQPRVVEATAPAPATLDATSMMSAAAAPEPAPPSKKVVRRARAKKQPK